MTDWNLNTLLDELHNEIHRKLETARTTMGDMAAKGDASESSWLQLFQKYLPKRYKVKKAFVIDSQGNYSEQMDIVIFDRQYSPLIFKYNDNLIIPAESVYAVFEVKQTINKKLIEYAMKKAESVKKLHRTSLRIPHAGGEYDPKKPINILGGILSFESDWSPPMGESFKSLLEKNKGKLDCGCIASHGSFFFNSKKDAYDYQVSDKTTTNFLFTLISKLQSYATVPMIDIMAYLEHME
ncbi:MAG: hypothetical protein OXC61_06060 [Flavobacteriaceae bacterium]|nr:hypothetical protein [Flavobacteriaceae bacterium]